MAFFLEPWAGRLLSILRIVTGFLIIQHGTGKFFGFPHVPMFENIDLSSLSGGPAATIELVGGALLLVGFLTRPVSFVLSGFMAAAYFIAHQSQGALPIQNGGELAVAWCFMLLYMAAAGGGPWSVDAARGRP
jgi:putative oxidoreductase